MKSTRVDEFAAGATGVGELCTELRQQAEEDESLFVEQVTGPSLEPGEIDRYLNYFLCCRYSGRH